MTWKSCVENLTAERDRLRDALAAEVKSMRMTLDELRETKAERDRYRKALDEIVTIYRNDYNNPDLCRDMADIATKALKGQC